MYYHRHRLFHILPSIYEICYIKYIPPGILLFFCDIVQNVPNNWWHLDYWYVQTDTTLYIHPTYIHKLFHFSNLLLFNLQRAWVYQQRFKFAWNYLLLINRSLIFFSLLFRSDIPWTQMQFRRATIWSWVFISNIGQTLVEISDQLFVCGIHHWYTIIENCMSEKIFRFYQNMIIFILRNGNSANGIMLVRFVVLGTTPSETLVQIIVPKIDHSAPKTSFKVSLYICLVT